MVVHSMASEKSSKKTGNDYARKVRGCWLVNFPAVYHAGIPDTLGVYRGIFIALEWKAPEGTPTRLQRLTLAAIRKAGGRTCVPRSRGDVAAFLDGIDEEIDEIVALAGGVQGAKL